MRSSAGGPEAIYRGPLETSCRGVPRLRIAVVMVRSAHGKSFHLCPELPRGALQRRTGESQAAAGLRASL